MTGDPKTRLCSLIEVRAGSTTQVVGVVVYGAAPEFCVVDPLPELVGDRARAAMAIRAMMNRLKLSAAGDDVDAVRAFIARQANAVRLTQPKTIEAPTAHRLTLGHLQEILQQTVRDPNPAQVIAR